MVWARGHGHGEPTQNENGSGWPNSGVERGHGLLDGDMANLNSKALDSCMHSLSGISTCHPVSNFQWRNRCDLHSVIKPVQTH